MDLLLDTNLFMLYVAGRADIRIIAVHKRLTIFSISDYEWLSGFVNQYDRLAIIPNVASGTSNLLAQIAEPFRTKLRLELKHIALRAGESYVPTSSAVQRPEYTWLGVTDAAILAVIGGKLAAMTTDLNLFRAAAGKGLPMMSFAQERYQLPL